MRRARITEDRTILKVTGADARRFLQDMVTNDIGGLAQGPVYAALLTPQGKYLFDFFLLADGDAVLADVKSDVADALAARLMMYRLRADVSIEPSDMKVVQGTGEMPDGALPDPRSAALGWRLYGGELPEGSAPLTDAGWLALRVDNMVPETGIELIQGETYILEAGFERLHGVSFTKGCFVGQEVTARMKHKTRLRKGLARVTLAGPAPAPGTPILHDGRVAGALCSASGDRALAFLRFDRAGEGMTAGPARVVAVSRE